MTVRGNRKRTQFEIDDLSRNIYTTEKQAQEGNSRVRLDMTNKRFPPPRLCDMSICRYNIDTISILVQCRYNTIPKNTQKYPEVPKNTQKYLEIPKNTQKSSELVKNI